MVLSLLSELLNIRVMKTQVGKAGQGKGLHKGNEDPNR